MRVFTAWLDYSNKWHCSEEVGADLVGSMPWSEDSARRFAKRLVGLSSGTATHIGTAKVAYCIHAPNRGRALTLAKQSYRGDKSKRITFSVRPKGSKKRKRVSFLARR